MKNLYSTITVTNHASFLLHAISEDDSHLEMVLVCRERQYPHVCMCVPWYMTVCAIILTYIVYIYIYIYIYHMRVCNSHTRGQLWHWQKTDVRSRSRLVMIYERKQSRGLPMPCYRPFTVGGNFRYISTCCRSCWCTTNVQWRLRKTRFCNVLQQRRQLAKSGLQIVFLHVYTLLYRNLGVLIDSVAARHCKNAFSSIATVHLWCTNMADSMWKFTEI